MVVCGIIGRVMSSSRCHAVSEDSLPRACDRVESRFARRARRLPQDTSRVPPDESGEKAEKSRGDRAEGKAHGLAARNGKKAHGIGACEKMAERSGRECGGLVCIRVFSSLCVLITIYFTDN